MQAVGEEDWADDADEGGAEVLVFLADDLDGADGLREDEEVGGAGGALVFERPGVDGQAEDDRFEGEPDGDVEGDFHVEALLGEAGGSVCGEGEAGGDDEAHAKEAGDAAALLLVARCGVGGAGAGLGSDPVAEAEGEQCEEDGPCLHGHLLDRGLHLVKHGRCPFVSWWWARPVARAQGVRRSGACRRCS